MSQQLLHTIRLAGPWEFQIPDDIGEWRTIKLPAEWKAIVEALRIGDGESNAPAHFCGAKDDLTARRRFQRPTGLEGGERVWIVVPDAGREMIKLRVNEADVETVEAHHPKGVAFDVTGSLQSRNVVTVKFDISRLMADDAIGSNFRGALIEIRAAGVNA